MWKIAFNGRFSGTPQPTGTQTAAYQLFNAIVQEPRNVELVIFADSHFLEITQWRNAPGVKWVEVPFQKMSRGRAHLWEQLQLPALCMRHGCSLVHHPIMTSSRWHPKCKSVVTLHDLNFYLHPEWYSRAFRMVYRVCAIPGLLHADCVVTISRYVYRQAEQHFHLSAPRLRMIYNGVNVLPPPPLMLGHSGRYFLCVGSLQPHKNLTRMIRAYLLFKKEFPDIELHVVGRPQPRFVEDPELYSLLSAPGVRLLGYLSQEQLTEAYMGAIAFCYPSLEEGFGLPILEAMDLGVPILTSNVSCLPEVSGPSAFLADPFSAEDLAANLKQILTMSPNERAAKIESGKKWASQFSWKSAARAYLQLYQELLTDVTHLF